MYEWYEMTPEEQRAELHALEEPWEPKPTKPLRVKPEPVKRERKPIWKTLDPSTIREAFDYNPQTGLLHRRMVRRCISHELPDAVIRSPHPVGTLHPLGFVVLKYEGRQWYAHRLAWLLMTGEEPRGHLHHVNGDRADNRWENLSQ